MTGTAAERLYTVPPRRFVAERSAAVAAAREAGDRAGAAELAKLRRPTVAAWLVNLLAWRRPELLAELARLAEALRTAQRELAGAQLRQLSSQRREVVAALVAQAQSLAAAADPAEAGGKLPLGEVEATLHAALQDPAVAEQVRSGQLVRSVTAAGFGELPPPRLRLVTGTGEGEPAELEAGPGEVTPAAARAELAEATAAVEAAEAEQRRLAGEQEAHQRELAGLDAQLAELTARRAEVAQQLVATEAASLAARRAVVAARRRAGEAEATLTALSGP